MTKSLRDESWVSSSEMARHIGVLSSTLSHHKCKYGHYYGLIPKKQANGRLLWPLHQWYEMLDKLEEGDDAA